MGSPYFGKLPFFHRENLEPPRTLNRFSNLPKPREARAEVPWTVTIFHILYLPIQAPLYIWTKLPVPEEHWANGPPRLPRVGMQAAGRRVFGIRHGLAITESNVHVTLSLNPTLQQHRPVNPYQHGVYPRLHARFSIQASGLGFRGVGYSQQIAMFVFMERHASWEHSPCKAKLYSRDPTRKKTNSPMQVLLPDFQCGYYL